MFRFPAPSAARKISAGLATTMAATFLVAALPGARPAEAGYNGVKSLHLAGVADDCQAGQALPCLPGAGTGAANVLQVVQSGVDGHLAFTGLDGTSSLIDHIWLTTEIGAECRFGHHLVYAQVDGDLSRANTQGLSSISLGSADLPSSWPRAVSVPHDKVMPTKRIAVNVPINDLFGNEPLIDFFPTRGQIYAAGEAEIERRIDGGMAEEDARALPWELHTAVSLVGEVRCRYNGVIQAEYYLRHDVQIPLTIEFVPAATSHTVAPPAKDQRVPGLDLTGPAQVTGAALSVVADPEDSCRLHLSASITTNRPTSVDYRFVDPFGRRSNTYTVVIDATHTAFVSRSVTVPVAPRPRPAGTLVAPTGPGTIGGLVSGAVDQSHYAGTYMLEILSPNHRLAADGFSVPFCTPTPQVTPVGGTAAGSLSRG